MTLNKDLGHFLEQTAKLEITPHFTHIVKYLINTKKTECFKTFVLNFAKAHG